MDSPSERGENRMDNDKTVAHAVHAHSIHSGRMCATIKTTSN
jgi:hypothetical protein